MIVEGIQEIPSLIDNSQHVRLSNSFVLRAIIRPDISAGRQVILAKRIPSSKGNRPGFVWLLRGTSMQLWTFGNNDKSWSIARTGRGYLQSGQTYEVAAVRDADKAKLYIDGVEYTHTNFQSASPSDINNDGYVFLGMQAYDGKAKDFFHGWIKAAGIYNDMQFNPKWLGKVSDWKRFKQDPVTRFGFGQLSKGN